MRVMARWSVGMSRPRDAFGELTLQRLRLIVRCSESLRFSLVAVEEATDAAEDAPFTFGGAA
jgi:hypothetical protein